VEYNEIIDLMKEMKNTGLNKVKIEQGDFKLVLEKNNIPASNTLQSPPVYTTSGLIYGSDHIINSSQTSETVANSSTDSLPMASNDIAANKSSDKDIPGTRKILSPMVGTFYAQPAPDKPAFVNLGDQVKKGQTVCIIEAMKLMNEIESEVEGQIIECLVENEEMVEFGQPLFIVK
jgi:acetyl-CoA carboxylase biotin carboxyl carrier protein